MHIKTSLSIYTAFAYILSLSAIGQIASDLYLPSLPSMQEDLGTTINTIQLSIACYMYGYGSMQIVYGPVSDAYGRKPTLLFGLSVMLVGTGLAIVASSASMLLLGRLLQGLGAASCNAIYKASIRDIFPAKHLAKINSYFAVFTVVTIAIAPLLGGFIEAYLGWRWNFFTISVMIIILMIFVGLSPETNRYKDSNQMNTKAIMENFKTLFKHKVFVMGTIATLLCYGGLLCWLTAGPFLIMRVLGHSAIEFGYIACIVGLAFALGGFFNGAAVTIDNALKFMQVGFSIMLFAGIFIYASTWFGINTYVITTGAIIFSFGSSFIVPNALALCMQPFKRMAGTAGAMLGFIKNLGGAIIGSIIALAPDLNQVPLAIAYTAIAGSGLVMMYYYIYIINQTPKVSP